MGQFLIPTRASVTCLKAIVEGAEFEPVLEDEVDDRGTMVWFLPRLGLLLVVTHRYHHDVETVNLYFNWRPKTGGTWQSPARCSVCNGAQLGDGVTFSCDLDARGENMFELLDIMTRQGELLVPWVGARIYIPMLARHIADSRYGSANAHLLAQLPDNVRELCKVTQWLPKQPG